MRKSSYSLVHGLWPAGLISITRTKPRGQNYPVAANYQYYYAPSPWDVPNRVSLGASYLLPGDHLANGIARRTLGGWTLAGTLVLQSGEPFTVSTNAPLAISTTASDGTTFCSSALGALPPIWARTDWTRSGPAHASARTLSPARSLANARSIGEQTVIYSAFLLRGLDQSDMSRTLRHLPEYSIVSALEQRS